MANIIVLIIEDEEFFATEVQDILNKLGYDVLVSPPPEKMLFEWRKRHALN